MRIFRDEVNWNECIVENRIILRGAILTVLRLIISIIAVQTWKSTGFGDLELEKVMRIVIPAVTFLEIGIQNVTTGFLIGMMKMRSVSEKFVKERLK